MQDDPVNNRGSSGVAVAFNEMRPRADLTTGQLVDHLEWSYNEGMPFDADVVWELARRALASEGRLGAADKAGSSQWETRLPLAFFWLKAVGRRR